MNGQRILSTTRWRAAAQISTLLVVLGASSACFSPPEVAPLPTGSVAAATVAASPTDIVTVAAVADTAPMVAMTTTVVVPPHVDAGFSAIAGTWSSEEFFAPVLEIGADGAFTLTHNYDDLGHDGADIPSFVITGSISVEEGRFLTDSSLAASLIPHGSLLLLDGYFDLILHRIGPDGNIQPYQPVGAIELPLIDSGMVISVAIVDSWTGLSLLAPIESQYNLNAGADGLDGTAHFSVAGYTDPITATVAISIPLADWQEALTALAGTPLESGPYLPVFSHTDDYPSVAFVIATSDQELRFESQSQGRNYVPWKVTVNGREYVTFGDSPARALQVLKPYLAGNILETLLDEARQ